MTNIVTITSQGQISIPAKLRRKLGFNKTKKALVFEEKGKVIIEPIKDLLDLGGSLKTNIKATPGQIRKAFEIYLIKHAISK